MNRLLAEEYVKDDYVIYEIADKDFINNIPVEDTVNIKRFHDLPITVRLPGEY